MDVSLATLRDVPALLEMMDDFNRLEHIVTWSRELGRAALVRLIADRSLGIVGIVHIGDAVAGYFVVTFGYDLEWNGRDAFLTELYLVPELRGHGQARALLANIESLAREHGVHALHLMVRPENTVARHLYESSGYVSPPRLFLSKDLRNPAPPRP